MAFFTWDVFLTEKLKILWWNHDVKKTCTYFSRYNIDNNVGSFAMWAGIYSISECTLIGLRNTDDAFNKIASGAITGGALAMRAGPRIAMKNALIGGIFLGAIVLF